MHIETTCIMCGHPLANRDNLGRPDQWTHINTTPDQPYCVLPTPPAQDEAKLPRATRKIRIVVTETVSYAIEKTVEIHAGIDEDELPLYLDTHDYLWIDDLGDDTYEGFSDREIDGEETKYIDADAYLDKVELALNSGGKTLTRWLTTTCPECGTTPDPDSTSHAVINGYVIIACHGTWLVNPEMVGFNRGLWKDWTATPTAG